MTQIINAHWTNATESLASGIGSTSGVPLAMDRSDVADDVADDVAKDLAELFRLLSDETRLRILLLLHRRHELNVRTLCQVLEQSQPAVSHHLALLRIAGLIDRRRDGKHNYYRLLPDRFGEFIRMMFSVLPGGDQQIRIDDLVLTWTHS